MAQGEFEKDFGYLMPFLDKIATAAGSVGNKAAREELTRLLAGEKQRWERIRSLLSGGSSAVGAGEINTERTSAAGQDASTAGSTTSQFSDLADVRPAFTVGSLRRRSG